MGGRRTLCQTLNAEFAPKGIHVAQQHRSPWTHELDLRAFSDPPRWNL